MLRQACPIMPSANFDKTEAFYKRLRFETWYKDDGYLLMNRDDVEIHFFAKPGHTPEQSDHGAYIRPDNVDTFSVEIAGLGLPRDGTFPKASQAEDKPWGMREATIHDPDGNLLRIGEVIDTNG